MKIIPHTNHRKIIMLMAFVAMAVIAGIILVLAFNGSGHSPQDIPSGALRDPDPAPSKLDPDVAQSKKDYIEKQQEKQQSSTPQTVSPGNIAVSASQQEEVIIITTKLSSIGDGTCRLTIRNNTQSYSTIAEVIYQPSYSTCAGFSVPISKLGNGSWNISVIATSLNGMTASDNLIVEVSP